ncbi:uncharacterized protein PITG_21124 [Phytophthora infestans T30-4]|uniref:Transcription activator GCR1-like domain-containing protein n=1 Tax=Phytophthora infestans (strain T30-4) TaxID=403677 RepID=D0P380_PHYIT|nr:uncharacterized protein PITG_21124 [Phytophthora infestans T30-4]EEY59061.1 hypothetical protein PITG_21124 [Phytophthora infestans T30-4]|eukprot:XP_002895236.1 hypothetical protein PITG_21124 [Phytophthora infestans T30-4]
MSRKINSEHELWAEWHEGLTNHPSTEYLEATYGRKWRLSAKESKIFSIRLCIIKHLSRRVGCVVTPPAARWPTASGGRETKNSVDLVYSV